jgi:aminoglycoside 2''-phosphotransferase
VQAIQDLIRRQAPGVRADALRLMPHPGWGGDSDAWLVDGRWIFRFPRSPEVAERLAIEVCLLPRLAPRLPLAIPRFAYVARDVGDRPAFVGYEALPGEPLRPQVLRSLPSETVDRVANQLGEFLRVLHQMPLAEVIGCGVPVPAAPPHLLDERRFAEIKATVFPVLADDERAWVSQRFASFLVEPSHFQFTPVLVHGDLGPDHIIFDPSRGELGGIIDFGDVAIGDPAGELTWRADYGEDFFRKVLSAYSPADDAFSERVAFRIDCLPLTHISYGLEMRRTADVVEGRRELKRRIGARPLIDRG